MALVALALVTFSVGSQAHAQHFEPVDGRTIYVVTLGGWVMARPKFDGSSDLLISGKPIVRWRRKGAREWLSMPNDSFGLPLFTTDNFRIGPAAAINFIREINPRRGGPFRLGDSNTSFEVGGFVEYWPVPWLRTRAELRRSVSGASGWISDLTANLVWQAAPAFTVAFGPRLSLASNAYMDDYFSISPFESSVTGLPVYKAGGGVRAYGAGVYGRLKLTEQWTTHASVEYERLAGDAGDSPIVLSNKGSADQYTFGLGLSYSFELAW